MKAIGNRRLRIMVQNRLEEYKTATTKLEKSMIVTSILSSIEQDCPPHGAFVSHNGKQYSKVSQHQAREKIASSFRNMLSEKYKSSSKNKVAQRRLARKRAQQELPQRPDGPIFVQSVPSPIPSQTRSSIVVSPLSPEFRESNNAESIETPFSVVLLEPIHSLDTIYTNDDLDLSNEEFDRTFFDVTTKEEDRPIEMLHNDHVTTISLTTQDIESLLDG